MPAADQRVNPPATAWAVYCRESARPLDSLVFVAPLLLIYEGGVLLLGPQALRNGADVWLRRCLDLAGFGQYFLLPILTCAVLLGWHHTSRQQWRCRWPVIGLMSVESMLFGFLLLILAQLQACLFSPPPAAFGCSIDSGRSDCVARVIGYCGAGIYEELLFRLMLLPAAAALLRLAGVSQKMSIASAVALTSLLFSAAHYDFFTGSGYGFDWFSFVFRYAAGVSFCLLFLFRGFGIAAGSHALYDIYVALWP